MENSEKQMTGEESLRIITDMLNRTRVNIRQGSFHLLLWGWVVVICSLGEFLLDRFTGIEHPYYIWMLTIPGAFVSILYGTINGRKAKVHTYADKIWMWTWMAFLFSMLVMFVIHSNKLSRVSPDILMLAAMPTFISGVIIRFRPLLIGGICFWVFALVVNFADPMVSQLGFPIAMIIGYLIPGYMLKRKVDHGAL
jgi:hypothetical protein